MTAVLEKAAAGPPAEPELESPPPRRWWLPVDPASLTALPCALAVAVVVAVQGWNIVGYPVITDDEGTYLSQAWAVQEGLGLAHYTYWYDHPPGGWLQIAVLSWVPQLLFPDLPAVAAARMIMPIVTGIACVVLYTVARRLGFARWAATLTILLFGLSPLAVTLQRQIYLDNIAVPWILAAFLFALSRRRHLWLHMGAGIATAMAVLSKETILVVLPAVVVVLWQRSSRETRAFSVAGFVSGLGLVGALYPLYALLKGEFFPGEGHVSLTGALLFQLADRQGSGSILGQGSGASTLLHSWLFYDNILIVGGTVAAVLALAIRRLRGPAVAALLLVLVALRPGGYLPAMYVIQVLPFFALVLVGVVETGVRAALGRPPELTPVAWDQPEPRWWNRFANREKAPIGVWSRRVRTGVVAVLAVVALTGVSVRWAGGTHRELVTDDNAEYARAADWIDAHVTDRAGTTLVVDDALWLDMIDLGFRRENVVWFYKLDLDPSVKRRSAHTVDYLISTPFMRQNEPSLPTVKELLVASHVVATIGSGDARIDIREVRRADS